MNNDDLELLLEALMQQRAGMQAPPTKASDLARMRYESEAAMQDAGRMRQPVGIGPARFFLNRMGNDRAKELEQKSLDTLLKAVDAQSGIDAYQAQIQAMDERIAAARKRQADLADYETKKGIDQQYAKPEKPDKPTYIDLIDPETGHKYKYGVNPDGTPGERVGMVSMADEKGSDAKGYGSVGAEAKVKIGLIANTANLFNRAIPVLFDGNEFRNSQALVPKSEVRIALDDLREGLQSMLRAVSGAAIPDSEIEREVESMMPSATDTDARARAKIDRAYGKVQSLWAAMTEGVDLPETLQIGERPQWSKPGDDLDAIADEIINRVTRQ
jgi:hypothetical protein